MFGTAGFKWFQDVLHQQVESRKQVIFLTPLKSLDEVPEQEFKKGEISGLALAKNLVEIRIQELSEVIADLTTEVENVQNSQTQTDGINSGDGRLDLSNDDPADLE